MFWSWKTFLCLYNMVSDLYTLYIINKKCRTWEEYKKRAKLRRKVEKQHLLFNS